MANFSTRMATTALRLIVTYGEAITLTRVVEGAYDPATGSTGAPTTTPYSGYGAPTNYNKLEVDGQQVKTSDIRLLVHALSVVPIPGDIVTLNSADYRVMDVDQTRAQGEDIIYTLQLRL